MLKLNASYSKKVPAEEDYSSKSYHASVEVELPDGLTGEQLSNRIHETFDLVRQSVESELGADKAERGQRGGREPAEREGAQSHPATRKFQDGNGHSGHRPSGGDDEPASNKQIKYLLDLTRERGIDPATLLRKADAASVYELTRAQCSALIDGITGAARRKAA